LSRYLARSRFAFLTVAALFALCPQGIADPAPAIHYAPAENLEHIGVALIDGDRNEIGMAAYVLTDWPVMPGAVLRRLRLAPRSRVGHRNDPSFDKAIAYLTNAWQS
jgi:hypothetical protein